MSVRQITKPTMVLDQTRCRQNIKTMAERAANADVKFRLHFKTHQSLAVGDWFKEYGVNCITVSSITMAKYFAAEWNDITVAMPVNIREIEEINELLSRIRLNLLVESEESVDFLRSHLISKVGVFNIIDAGYGRTGVSVRDFRKLDAIISGLSSNDNSELGHVMEFCGFFVHNGHSYDCRSQADIRQCHENSLAPLMELKARYKTTFPDIILSMGDTPSCSVITNFDGIEEIRPGNFVFYDLMQTIISSCEISDIAMAEACPIVAVHEERYELIIYGGGIHLSKDHLDSKEHDRIYGLVVNCDGRTLTDIVPQTFVKKLSQEHGMISAINSGNYKVGDLVYILPVHSCMAVDLLPYFHCDGEVLSTMNK